LGINPDTSNKDEMVEQIEMSGHINTVFEPESLPYNALQTFEINPERIVKLSFRELTKTLKFNLSDKVSFVYNQEFGLKINSKFYDIDLQLGPASPLYIVFLNHKLSLTVGGLSFVDLIYQTEQDTKMTLTFDSDYTQGKPQLFETRNFRNSLG
jgi:hypothetical protein